MSKRFTITEKWEDSWFWQLKPYEKLLWNYLCDKCDLAGFWEINLELATVQTKIPKSAISGAVQGLSRGYITNGKYVWLRNFIHHQGNYPLNPNNNAHRHIIKIIERHTDFDVNFFELLETVFSGATEGLISPPSKGKGNSKGKGKYSDGFEKFWNAYPKKKSKDDAWRRWNTIKPNEEDVQKILIAIEQQKKSKGWLKDGGQFIPYPATWLNAGGWKDEECGEDRTCPHCRKQGVRYQMEGGEKVWRCQEYLDQLKSTPAADKVGNPLKQVPQSGAKIDKQAAIRRLKGAPQ
jgi:hypothetical protein